MEKYPKLASWASDSGSLGIQYGYERDTNNCAELQPAAHSGQPLLSARDLGAKNEPFSNCSAPLGSAILAYIHPV